MERREQRIYAPHLYRIAQVTGVAINYFYSDDNAATNAHPTERAYESQRLIEAYVGIHDPALRHDIAALVQSVADAYEGVPPNKKDE